MQIVVDNSIVVAWCLADEIDPLAETARRRVVRDGAVVPGIWWYELRNALLVNERRGRLDAADTDAILADILQMPFALDRDHDDHTLVALARQHGLTAYDSAYLEVALRRGLPLASLDRRLRQVAEARGAVLWTAE